MKAYERLLKYVKIHTTSDENSGTHPSSKCQFELANLLVSEMNDLGISKVRVDEHAYVYGEIPATKGYENCPSIGFIAHMDTSPDASGENVNPQIIENYNGEDVVLPATKDILSVKVFPHLSELKGRTLITTDGSTLLGADDKAGIAEIMTACEILLTSDIPHGKICIGFTPDEEVGEGADFFNVKEFGADFAYTVDGSREGEIEYENFNAAACKFEVRGVSVHPGSSKNTMVNAALVAFEINSMLPSGEIPRHTKGYEGFYHLTDMSGDVTNATLSYIIRDHSATMFEARKETLKHIADLMNEKYGEGTVSILLKDNYRNMLEMIEPNFHLIENAREAIQKVGLTPITTPIRGGTDGARLSFMGLPCPNLGTGGFAFHGNLEHITVEGMELSTLVLIEIMKLYSKEDYK
ncbi:peptidase T [Anaeromicropila herbilytica]|uniref:Peptidase T n=1 Tax=Anaeromicropila herbilytica TaxID=2785025 RepID=A0A7R7ELY2_9FIRM|nr:peptidase T [Anaeromicropila herbilytica]BCN31184.1 peptidase T [Anaeromicropila herbilytica]